MKRLLNIFGLIFAAIIICIIGIVIWRCPKNHSYKEEKKLDPICEFRKDFVTDPNRLSELPEDFVTDVYTIREVTQCKDLPEFEAKRLWYDIMDGAHSEPHINCFFTRKMTEYEFDKFSKIKENIYWGSDSEWTLSFSRGWSKEEYMDVPKGMKEDIAVKIENLSPAGFTLSYWRNVKSKPIDGEIIKRITELRLPSFYIVSYISDLFNVHAKLRYDNMADNNMVNVIPYRSEIIKVDTFINGKWFIFKMKRDEQYADLQILSSRCWGCATGRPFCRIKWGSFR